MKKTKLYIHLVLAAFVSVISVSGQVVLNGNTITVNGTVTNFPGITIGSSVSSSALIITNGGYVTNTLLTLLGEFESSRTNRLLVTGAGSSLSNRLGLAVGDTSALNLFVVTNGGRVTSGLGVVGSKFNSTNNTAIITGPNSLWAMSGDLTVGDAGGFSVLMVTNRALVKANNFIVGNNPSAISNTVNIADGIVAVTNVAGISLMDIRRGTLRITGGDVVLDRLWVTNAAAGFIFNYGNLTTLHGATLVRTNHLVIGSLGGDIARWTMTGGTNRVELGIFQSTYLGQFGGQQGVVTVTGPSTVWSNAGPVHIGYGGYSNQLFVANGALVDSTGGYLGTSAGCTDNEAWITGAGSRWNAGYLNVGNFGINSRLVVTNGGWLQTSGAALGSGNYYPSNNTVLLTGAGSGWQNDLYLQVGYGSSSNALTVASNAVLISPYLTASSPDYTSNNLISVLGGSIITTNSSTNAILEIGPGGHASLEFFGGLIRADRFVATNGARSVVHFTAGTLQTSGMAQNGTGACIVGNGSGAATLELLGDNLHTFAKGLLITNNAQLKGNGGISGNVVVRGSFSPGSAVGALRIYGGSFTALPGSTNWFELDKAAGTNDLLIADSLSYGGSLIVSNLGGTLASGDVFKLFSAPSYPGAFTNIQLPALTPGLAWTNKLALNGSVEITGTAFEIRLTGATKTAGGAFQFGFTNPPGSSLTVFASTNVSWALSGWSNLGTATEIAPGQFQFTDNQATNHARRFYRVRLP